MPRINAKKRLLSINLTKHNILSTDDGYSISNHVTLSHFIQTLQMRITWRTDLQTIWLIRAIRHQINTKFTLRMFNGRICFASWNMETFREQFEVMDQLFHIRLHVHAVWRCHFVIIRNHRTLIISQPLNALFDNAVGLTHFFNTNEIAIVAIAINTNRNVKIEQVVDFVWLFFTQIPLDTRTTQHRTSKSFCQCTFRTHNTDTNQTLLPNTIICQQRFVLVNITWKAISKIFNKIEQRTLAIFIHFTHNLRIFQRGSRELRHLLWQIAINATWAVVRCMQTRTRHCLVAIHQIFTFTECIQEHRHRTNVESMRTDPHQVIQNTGNFIEHHANVLSTHWNFESQHFLNRHDVRVLIRHHRHVIETIHIRY